MPPSPPAWLNACRELGGLVADRVRSTQAPETATLDDLIYANDHAKPRCELIDNTLVQKAVGGDVLPGFECVIADLFSDLDAYSV